MFAREAGLEGSLLGIGARSDKTSLYAPISYLLLIASLLILLIWACSCVFCRFLSNLVCCFRSASLAFLNWDLRSKLGLLLLISYWSLIFIIQSAPAMGGLSINLIFLDIPATFRIPYLWALEGIVLLSPWKLNWHRHVKNSSTYSSRSGQGRRNSCILARSSSYSFFWLGQKDINLTLKVILACHSGHLPSI